METMNLDLIEALKIEYSAKFVPFSQSRNKDNEHKSLNWLVTLKRNGVELSTDYTQGIGHHPFYKQTWGKPTPEQRRLDHAIERTAETCQLVKPIGSLPNNFRPGFVLRKNRKEGQTYRTDRLQPPDLKDVLYSLIMDSDVLQHDSFGSWASDFGYDTDSREAEKTYQACLAIALKVNRMFTSDELDSLREFYQDY